MQKAERLHYLDSLRGLGAVIVVLQHWRNLLTVHAAPFYILIFMVGQKALMMFFVVSGYVLSLPYWKQKQLPYSQYLIKRICRIYLPFAGALLFAVLIGSRLLDTRLPLTIWFYQTWHTAFTPKLVFSQLAFAWEGGGAAIINPAFWTLRPEMIMSILFPAVCWLLSRLPTVGGWVLAIAMLLLGEGKVPLLTAHISGELLNLIFYASAFIFGAMLSKGIDQARRFYRRMNVPARYLLVALVVFGFYHGVGETGVSIPASCGLIILADCSRLRDRLMAPTLLYLGKISYSLYLLHFVFLMASLILLYGKVPLWMVFMTYVTTSLVAAHFYNMYVETGSIALSKRLTDGTFLVKEKEDHLILESAG